MPKEDGNDAIEKLVQRIREIVKSAGIQQDRTGCWFSNNQLDTLRKLYSFGGYEKARLYQAGKIDIRGNRYDIARNRALLQILEVVRESRLEPKVVSYVIGKLNQVLQNY
jgi:hypothetical protein